MTYIVSSGALNSTHSLIRYIDEYFYVSESVIVWGTAYVITWSTINNSE